MREYAGPALSLRLDGNLTDDLVRLSSDHPQRALLSVVTSSGWSDVVAADVHEQVRALARGLVAQGLQPGDRVLLQCSSRFEWTLLDYAIWYAGAVSVPVYPSSPVDQVAWAAEHSGATAAVVETVTQQADLQDVTGSLLVWCLEAGAIAALTSAGSPVDDGALEGRRRASGPESPATIVYTSGTTGRPRGCVLTHGNLMAEVRAAVLALEPLFREDHASTLLVLPLPHVFARVVQLGAVHAGVRLGFGRGAAALIEDLRTFRPTFLVTVPRQLETVYAALRNRAAADGRSRRFDHGVDAAIAYSRSLDTSRGTRGWTRARHATYDRLVYAGVRADLGGRCAFAVSGGASLGDGLAHFFRGCGITVLEGYGLTETSAAVTVNTRDAVKLATAGRPLPGVAVRVGDDGELLVSGPQVFPGYWDDEAATRSAFTPEGWFRTGDVGEIDDEGFVTVTGRKQELLITAGGKSVAPVPLEDRVRAHPLVDQCLVVGDGRPFVAALITLDPDTLAGWAARHGKDTGVDRSPAELMATLADDRELNRELQAAVDAANAAVSRAEAIRRFLVLPHPWTEEAGQVTPSLKVRRSVVLRTASSWIDRLYAV